MGAPFNYLLAAPSEGDDALGHGMHHNDFMRRVRVCNPNLTIPDPSVHTWYPGKAAGQTAIWLGEPLKGKKITTFHLGIIPEWTQIDPQGLIIRRGWRSVLQRLIARRCITKLAAERAFHITLDLGKPSDICQQCLREGRGRVPTKAASRLCDTHDKLTKQVSLNRRRAKDAPLAMLDGLAYMRRNPHSVILKGK